MTTYTAISTTEIESGKPVTESLMTRLANNLLAVVEGDSTAPDFKARALVKGSATLSASTSRSSAANLGATDSGYYEYLSLTFDSDFLANLTASVSVGYTFIAGGGAAEDQNNIRIQLDGTTIYTNTSPNPSGSASVSASISPGSHTLSFQSDPLYTLPATFTGSISVNGDWL